VKRHSREGGRLKEGWLLNVQGGWHASCHCVLFDIRCDGTMGKK
jgi:hypothetical protein